MKILLRSLILWTTLAGVAWLVLHPSAVIFASVGAGLLHLFSLAAASWLTWWAVSALPESKLGRWSFWTVTTAGWLAVAILLQGRLEGHLHADDRQVIYLSFVAMALTVGGIALRTRSLPRLRVLGDLAVGVLMLGVAGGISYRVYELNTSGLRTHAVSRWQDLGLPLDTMESSLPPGRESDGSQVVREVFRELLSQGFYKSGTAAANREPAIPKSEVAWQLVTHACEVISKKLPPSDDIDLAALPVAEVAAHATEIDAACRRILAADPATWAFNPKDGYAISVPNFLGVRMFSQLATAESLRRFAIGDQEGAARILAAIRHTTAKLEQSPTLVNLSLHLGIESLLASQEARVSIPGGDLAAIAQDAKAWQAALLRCLQWEAWSMLRYADTFGSIGAPADEFSPRERFTHLPRWTHPWIAGAALRRQAAISAMNLAESAALRLAPETARLDDLGYDQEEAIAQKRPSSYWFGASRLAIRINVTLLLREQAFLIRDARTRLAAGQPVESRASVVLPHLRWEVTADAEKQTVTTRLAHAPRWATDSRIMNAEDFWLLPLDGSVAWQFRPSVKGTAAR